MPLTLTAQLFLEMRISSPLKNSFFREGEAPAEPELRIQLASAAQRELRPPLFNGLPAVERD